MVTPDDVLASWRSSILGEDPTLAAAAVRDYGALCVATRDDLRSAAGHVDAGLTARWLSLTSLGATVIGELLERCDRTSAPAELSSIRALGRAVQQAMGPLSARRHSGDSK